MAPALTRPPLHSGRGRAFSLYNGVTVSTSQLRRLRFFAVDRKPSLTGVRSSYLFGQRQASSLHACRDE